MRPSLRADLRRTEREHTKLRVNLVLGLPDGHTTYEASTVDISLEGASIRTHHELVPGERVGIVRKDVFPYAIPTRVVWVRPDDSLGAFYLAGLQFLDTPPV